MILSLSLIFHFLAVYVDIYWFLSRERLVVLFRSEDSDLSLILKHSQLWSLLPVTSCPDSCLFYFSETPIKHILEFFELSCISVNTYFLHRFFFFCIFSCDLCVYWYLCTLTFVVFPPQEVVMTFKADQGRWHWGGIFFVLSSELFHLC